MNLPKLQDLELFLDTAGVVFEPLDRDDRSLVVQQWLSVFGDAFRGAAQYKEGVKAWYALGQVGEGDFVLFSITNELPFWRSSEVRHQWGYGCTKSKILDLGQFCNLDFIMVASDFAWTMVYTHEDFALGGPYFVEQKWCVAPDDLKLSNRQANRRRRRC